MPEKCGLFRVLSTCSRFSLKTETFQFDLPSTRIRWKRSPKAHLFKNALQSVACATDETKLWLSPSAKQRRNPSSGPPPVCTRIWVHAMIGPLKEPLSIRQSGWKEIRNVLPVIRCVSWAAQNKDMGAAPQTLLTGVKWRMQRRPSRLFTVLYFSVRSSRSSGLRLRAAILHECQNYLGGRDGFSSVHLKIKMAAINAKTLTKK